VAAPNRRLAVQPGIVWAIDEAASMVETWNTRLDSCHKTIVRVVTTEAQLRTALEEFGSESYAAELGRFEIDSLPFGLVPRIVVVGCLDGPDRAKQWEAIAKQADRAGADLARGATIHHVVLMDSPTEYLDEAPSFPQLRATPWVIGARNNVKLAIDPASRQSLVASLLDALLFAEYTSDCAPQASPFRSSDADGDSARFLGYPRLLLTDLEALLAQRLERAVEKSLADAAMTDPPTAELQIQYRRTVEEFCSGNLQFDAMKEQLFGLAGFEGWEPAALARCGEDWCRELGRILDFPRQSAHVSLVRREATTPWGRFVAWLKRLFSGTETYRSEQPSRTDQEIQWLRQRLTIVANWSHELRIATEFEATLIPAETPRYATLQDAIAAHLQHAISTGSSDSSWRDEVGIQAHALARENFFRLLEWAAPSCPEAAEFLAAIQNGTLFRWSGLLAADIQMRPQGGVTTAGADSHLADVLPIAPATLRVCGSCRPFLLLASQTVPLQQIRA